MRLEGKAEGEALGRGSGGVWGESVGLYGGKSFEKSPQVDEEGLRRSVLLGRKPGQGG